MTRLEHAIDRGEFLVLIPLTDRAARDIRHPRGLDFKNRAAVEHPQGCAFRWEDGWGRHACTRADRHEGRHRCRCDLESK